MNLATFEELLVTQLCDCIEATRADLLDFLLPFVSEPPKFMASEALNLPFTTSGINSIKDEMDSVSLTRSSDSTIVSGRYGSPCWEEPVSNRCKAKEIEDNWEVNQIN